jgi:hypothetical protein
MTQAMIEETAAPVPLSDEQSEMLEMFEAEEHLMATATFVTQMASIEAGQIAEAEADRRCAAMLRKSIIDMMALMEAFGLLETGLVVAMPDDQHVMMYQARMARLRNLCELREGESWRAAQRRHEAVSA